MTTLSDPAYVPANGEPTDIIIPRPATSESFPNDGRTYVAFWTKNNSADTCTLSSIAAADSGRSVGPTVTVSVLESMNGSGATLYVAGPFKRRNFGASITATTTGANCQIFTFRPFGA